MLNYHDQIWRYFDDLNVEIVADPIKFLRQQDKQYIYYVLFTKDDTNSEDPIFKKSYDEHMRDLIDYESRINQDSQGEFNKFRFSRKYKIDLIKKFLELGFFSQLSIKNGQPNLNKIGKFKFN